MSPADEAHGVRTPCRSSTSATFSATRVGGGAQRGIIDQSCRDSDNMSALLTLPTARRRPGGGVAVPPSPPPFQRRRRCERRSSGGTGLIFGTRRGLIHIHPRSYTAPLNTACVSRAEGARCSTGIDLVACGRVGFVVYV